MAQLLKQSSTAQPLLFLLVQSADHITPLTGASPTVTLSKAGAAFGSPAGAVTEVGSGWYKVAGNATDTNTLGVLILHATATSGDPADVVFEIVSFDPQDAAGLGLSRIDAAVTSRLASASYTAPDNATITAIKAKTDNLPSDPADASDILVATNTIAGYIDTEVAAIKAKTDLLPAAPAAVGDIPTAANVADAVWDEAIAGHAVAGSAGAALTTAGTSADPLLNTVPGAYASGTAGAALGRIGSGQIVTTSPVAPDGDVTIWAGYDMLAADGYSLDWTDTSNVWPTLTGATIAMICRGPSTMTFVGSVVTATGSSKKVRVELQDTQTVDMPISNHWVYDVAATLTGGDVIPLVKGGRLYVKAKPG